MHPMAFQILQLTTRLPSLCAGILVLIIKAGSDGLAFLAPAPRIFTEALNCCKADVCDLVDECFYLALKGDAKQNSSRKVCTRWTLVLRGSK